MYQVSTCSVASVVTTVVAAAVTAAVTTAITVRVGGLRTNWRVVMTVGENFRRIKSIHGCNTQDNAVMGNDMFLE
jgi:phosphate/sulfate permease